VLPVHINGITCYLRRAYRYCFTLCECMGMTSSYQTGTSLKGGHPRDGWRFHSEKLSLPFRVRNSGNASPTSTLPLPRWTVGHAQFSEYARASHGRRYRGHQWTRIRQFIELRIIDAMIDERCMCSSKHVLMPTSDSNTLCLPCSFVPDREQIFISHLCVSR
jgi:hypothetical protein